MRIPRTSPNSVWKYAIHVEPLDPTSRQDLDDYANMTFDRIREIVAQCPIVYVETGYWNTSPLAWDRDGYETTAVFLCESHAEARYEAVKFLCAQKAWAQTRIIHQMADSVSELIGSD